ncbi:MAG: hypothetical protein ACOC8B_00150 [Gemmatimonadota bacterium]
MAPTTPVERDRAAGEAGDTEKTAEAGKTVEVEEAGGVAGVAGVAGVGQANPAGHVASAPGRPDPEMIATRLERLAARLRDEGVRALRRGAGSAGAEDAVDDALAAALARYLAGGDGR